MPRERPPRSQRCCSGWGPLGNDLAAHVYQRTVFLHDGFQLWNNFWYGGRYAFVTYSVLYYPLAALFGIKALAVTRSPRRRSRSPSSSAGSGGPGTLVQPHVRHRVGRARHLGRIPVRPRDRAGLLAIWAFQAGKRWYFGVLAVLTLAASPLAFLLLAIFLFGVGLGMRDVDGDCLRRR